MNTKKQFNPRDYDTRLTPEMETQYQEWLSTIDESQRNDTDYDLRGFYLAARENRLGDNQNAFDVLYNRAKGAHFVDTFKKPNHPTFSTGSIYNGVNGYYGGQWVEDPSSGSYMFIANPTNFFSPEELRAYFDRVERENYLYDPRVQTLTTGIGIQEKVAQNSNTATKFVPNGLF